MKKSRNDHSRKNRKRTKPEKCAVARKPTDYWVHFKAIGNADGQIEIKIGGDGEITCRDAIEGEVCGYESYNRNSGKEKIVAQSRGAGKSAFLNLRANIEANYDVIAGIDTNGFLFGGRKLSITAAYCSDAILKQRGDHLEATVMPAFVISNIRSGINPEVIGWHLFMKHLLPLIEIRPQQRLCLVVDSDLGRHRSINSRSDFYYRDHLLPDAVDLVYASSDTGRNLPNRLLAACDRASRQIYSLITSGKLVLPNTLGGATEDFEGYAYINLQESKYRIRG